MAGVPRDTDARGSHENRELSRRALHSLLAVNFFIEPNRMESATSQGSNPDTR